jgi:hypothetical protein
VCFGKRRFRLDSDSVFRNHWLACIAVTALIFTVSTFVLRFLWRDDIFKLVFGRVKCKTLQGCRTGYMFPILKLRVFNITFNVHAKHVLCNRTTFFFSVGMIIG